MPELRIVERTWFGRGSVKSIGDALRFVGGARPFVVVDRALEALPPRRALDEALRGAGLKAGWSFDTEPEPTTDCVDRNVALARAAGADSVVGLGGGSAMDLAKAVAVLLGNEGPAADYQGLEKIKAPGVPKVMIPTTAGTGSETTQSAVLINKAIGRKGGINGRWVMPEAAILDADMLDGIPQAVAASSAMDAVTHALESLTAKNRTWISERFSRAALELLLPALRPALIGREPQAFEDLLHGSFSAGVGIANSETGGCHALAYPLGVHFGIPHGAANSILLPHVMRHNMADARPVYAEFSRLLFGDTAVETLPERVDALSKEIGVKNRLSQWGVAEKDLEMLSVEGIKLPGPIANNPAPIDSPAARRIYAAAL